MKTGDFLFQKPYLRSSEVARLFNVDHSTVFLWVKKGKLHPVKTLGGNFRFSRAEVEQLFGITKGAGAEKRTGPRFQVHFPVQIKAGGKGKEQVFNAIIHDIGKGGMGLRVENSSEFAQKIRTENISLITIINQATSLFKDVIPAQLKFVQHESDTATLVGVSLVD